MNLRKYTNLISVFIILCISASCTHDDDLIKQSEAVKTDEKVDVRVVFDGDVLELNDLLTRAGSDDLLAIKIYSSPTYADDYTFYAYGLYDDVNIAMNLSLYTGRKYYIQSAMIRNGKNIVEKKDEHNGIICDYYKFPFYSVITNQLCYSINDSYWHDDLLSFSDCFNTYYSHMYELDRYYGELKDYIPSYSSTVTLSLNKVSSRVVINAKGLKTSAYVVVWNRMESYGAEVLGNTYANPVQTVKILPLPGDENGYYTSQWFEDPINKVAVSCWLRLEDGLNEEYIECDSVILRAGKTTTIDIDFSSYYATGPIIEIPGEDDWD